MFIIHSRADRNIKGFYPSLPLIPYLTKQRTCLLRLLAANLLTASIFFTLTLDFILAFPFTADGYNILMSVTCKFFKRVTLIKGKDTQTAKKQAHVFLVKLDLVNQCFLGELIINCDLKFLSRFWTALFKKLEVKLFYSITYHPQIDGSNKRINQTVEITLQFFVHTLENPKLQSQVLPKIQAIINNTSSSLTRKTPNNVAYSFFPRRSMNLLVVVPALDMLGTRTNIEEVVSFALLNQNLTYNWKHQHLFIKIGEQAMLRFHKRYSILMTAAVTKQLTQ